MAAKAGVKGALGKKLGPLPVWAWLLVGAAGIAAGVYIKRRMSSSSQVTAPQSTSIPDTTGVTGQPGGTSSDSGSGTDTGSSVSPISGAGDLSAILAGQEQIIAALANQTAAGPPTITVNIPPTIVVPGGGTGAGGGKHTPTPTKVAGPTLTKAPVSASGIVPTTGSNGLFGPGNLFRSATTPTGVGGTTAGQLQDIASRLSPQPASTFTPMPAPNAPTPSISPDLINSAAKQFAAVSAPPPAPKPVVAKSAPTKPSEVITALSSGAASVTSHEQTVNYQAKAKAK